MVIYFKLVQWLGWLAGLRGKEGMYKSNWWCQYFLVILVFVRCLPFFLVVPTIGINIYSYKHIVSSTLLRAWTKIEVNCFMLIYIIIIIINCASTVGHRPRSYCNIKHLWLFHRRTEVRGLRQQRDRRGWPGHDTHVQSRKLKRLQGRYLQLL